MGLNPRPWLYGDLVLILGDFIFYLLKGDYKGFGLVGTWSLGNTGSHKGLGFRV